MPELVPVRVRDCACPDSPHADGDIVYLAPVLDIDGGTEAESDVVDAAGDARKMKRLLLRTFVTYGAKGWNLVDAEGAPVPFDVEPILADWSVARIVADKAADLYTDMVVAPFEMALQARSPTGPTAPTTSRRRQPTRT
jgi:hypothetical protein